MFDRILNRMREKIRMRQYIMTYHTRREMYYDDLTIYDIERGILTGKILERQKDETTNEWKYRITGKTVESGKVEIIVKISPTDKLVIITVICNIGMRKKIMICDICGHKGAHVRRVVETYGKGKNLLVIENIPMVSCPDCGQSYFTAETLHEIERIRLHHKSFAVERPVEVAKFG